MEPSYFSSSANWTIDHYVVITDLLYSRHFSFAVNESKLHKTAILKGMNDTCVLPAMRSSNICCVKGQFTLRGTWAKCHSDSSTGCRDISIKTNSVVGRSEKYSGCKYLSQHKSQREINEIQQQHKHNPKPSNVSENYQTERATYHKQTWFHQTTGQKWCHKTRQNQAKSFYRVRQNI